MSLRVTSAPLCALLFLALLPLTSTLAATGAGGSDGQATTAVRLWEPCDFAFEASGDHPWWEFPVRGDFRHEETGEQFSVEGFWDNGRRWVVRFAGSRAGTWTYRTQSRDPGLDGRAGQLQVSTASAEDLGRNPNLRGPVRLAPGRQYFTYQDGMPFFLLADTVWALNTARCGLGEKADGPFFRYLAERKPKGFTAILMQYFHGYGDYPDSPGHRNEGGVTFPGRDVARIDPGYFRALDRRMQALWNAGLVAAINATWWGKTKDCIFKPEDARRISAYCAVRYGAFNALWSLSGEYQYAFSDCGWKPEDFTALGAHVQAHNPWRRPLSIHPSGQTRWPAPHGVQSSRPFHGESWLDHHWLQTGQSRNRLHYIVSRLAENRALRPPMPVFLSEAWYESATDPDIAYHMRWQVWTAFLNGAAGFGYGAYGLWQFFDPNDPTGDKGKDAKDVVPWWDAIRQPGSGQMVHARTLLESIDWWRLEPQRDRLRVDGQPNPAPGENDLSPPHAAAIPDRLTIVYIPRGNAERKLTLVSSPAQSGRGRWYDPRTGKFGDRSVPIPSGTAWALPAPPAVDEDWVLMIEHAAGSGSG